MTNIAVSVENVSKMYRLGQVGTGTLAHDLNRWWHKIRGKEDPYLKLGQENKRDSKGGEYVWALQNVSFEVNKGEVLGIIGKNGAGKSTLLKLLSRVTVPTNGTIKAKGRIASLLEVGTGFHPELTGRENIFLNGAILGMTKAEIRRKFDEIVDFAGVERYIETPVKRYSSGMYVRLAFAVAAHLESEILIVDEVLAVGDAEFQAKCMGKMGQISKGQGRTVLFVSHNMGSIKNLCNKSILMERGTIKSIGPTASIIDQYLTGDADIDRFIVFEKDQPGNNKLKLHSIKVIDESGSFENSLLSSSEIRVEIEFILLEEIKDLRVVATLMTVDGDEILITSDYHYQSLNRIRRPGRYTSVLKFPRNFFNAARYHISIDIEIPFIESIIQSQTVSFNIDQLTNNELGASLQSRPPGIIHPKFEWAVNYQS